MFLCCLRDSPAEYHILVHCPASTKVGNASNILSSQLENGAELKVSFGRIAKRQLIQIKLVSKINQAFDVGCGPDCVNQRCDSSVIWREDSMTRFVVGDNRGQRTLFPERLEGYLSEDNPVGAIDVFVA